MKNEHGGEGNRGTRPDGGKRRWTRAQKFAAKRIRIEELLAIARTWRESPSAFQTNEVKCTTLTRDEVGRWVEELPRELWELILERLSAIDCLRCVTSSKAMMMKY